MNKRNSTKRVVASLKSKFPTDDPKKINSGVEMVYGLWRPSDGNVHDLEVFCLLNYVGQENQDKLAEKLDRFCTNVYGLKSEMDIRNSMPLDVDTGEMDTLDYSTIEFSLDSAVSEEFFRTKVAFTVVLNFPYIDLPEAEANATRWGHLDWVRYSLSHFFTSRPPQKLIEKQNQLSVKASDFVNNYTIKLNEIPVFKDDDEEPLFHWRVRDKLTEYYHSDGHDAIEKQNALFDVVEKAVTQDIPKAWLTRPFSRGENYEYIRKYYLLDKEEERYGVVDLDRDVYYEHNVGIQDTQMAGLILEVLGSKEAKQVANLFQTELGRELQPFDLWFNLESDGPKEDYDRLVAERYPTLEHMQDDIPRILALIGFSNKEAQSIANRILAEPGRGCGHCYTAVSKEFPSRLRVKMNNPSNMNDFQTFMHELGHAVEGVLSSEQPYYLLNGVPCSGVSEAFAFMFEEYAEMALGVGKQDTSIQDVNMLWSTYEIAGVAKVEVAFWEWLESKSGKVTKAQMVQKMASLCEENWAYFFGRKSHSLGMYSHMISHPLYLSNYVLGYLVLQQIKQYVRGKNLAEEMKRMCRLPQTCTNAWMEAAVGARLSAEPLLEAAGEAVNKITQSKIYKVKQAIKKWKERDYGGWPDDDLWQEDFYRALHENWVIAWNLEERKTPADTFLLEWVGKNG